MNEIESPTKLHSSRASPFPNPAPESIGVRHPPRGRQKPYLHANFVRDSRGEIMVTRAPGLPYRLGSRVWRVVKLVSPIRMGRYSPLAHLCKRLS